MSDEPQTDPSQLVCPEGHWASADQRYCTVCGKPIARSARRGASVGHVWAVTALAMILLVGAVAMFLGLQGSKATSGDATGPAHTPVTDLAAQHLEEMEAECVQIASAVVAAGISDVLNDSNTLGSVVVANGRDSAGAEVGLAVVPLAARTLVEDGQDTAERLATGLVTKQCAETVVSGTAGQDRTAERTAASPMVTTSEIPPGDSQPLPRNARDDGYGAIRLGMSTRELLATGEVLQKPADPAAGPCASYVLVWGGTADVGYGTNRVIEIAFGPNMRTAQGIALGSVAAELRRAYPELATGAFGLPTAPVTPEVEYRFRLTDGVVDRIWLASKDAGCFT